jgi:hypothetical protein
MRGLISSVLQEQIISLKEMTFAKDYRYHLLYSSQVNLYLPFELKFLSIVISFYSEVRVKF